MGVEGCGESAFEADVVMKSLMISAAASVGIRAHLILTIEKESRQCMCWMDEA